MTLAIRTPSRHDNPFATCWTRPGAIPFRFRNGINLERLVARLIARNGRGAIIGAHGSGKSTLLEALKPALLAAGYQLESVFLRDGQRALPQFTKSLCQCGSKPMLLIDGYEQLNWVARLRLKRHVRARQAGLLVTAHQPTDVPTLIKLSPDLKLVQELVGALATRVSTSVTADDIAASHACHGSNVREIFFDLYDRHEQGQRQSRSVLSLGQ